MSFLKTEKEKNKGIISKKYKFIYFPIPKVACSSIKALLAKMMKIKLNKELHKTIFPEIRGISSYDYPYYYKFAFVRNPWDRLVSCFKSKISKYPGINNSYLINGVHKEFFKKYENLFRGGMSFYEFVKSISIISDNNADEHFRSQYTFLTDNKGNLLTDFIGKFENLDNDFNKISVKIFRKKLKLPHLNKSKEGDYRDYYDNKLKKIVGKRYKKDIKIFSCKF